MPHDRKTMICLICVVFSVLLFDFIDCQGRPPVLNFNTCGQFAEGSNSGWGNLFQNGAPYGRSVFCGANSCGFRQPACNASAVGESQARFGFEKNISEPLGLAFRPINGGSLTIDKQTNLIALGTLSHMNFYVDPAFTVSTGLVSVVLQLHVSLTSSLSVSWNVTFQLDNTPNTAPCNDFYLFLVLF